MIRGDDNLAVSTFEISEIDLDATWRPHDPTERPVCLHTFRGHTCTKRGPHYCEPRADRVVAFFAELLCHTKGPHARKPFLLRDWQEYEIIRPLFGEVVWTDEHMCYVRRYRIAHIYVARKQGKSELAAGILLYMLVGDDEESSEVYSAAADTKQAGKVFEPADRMRQLSPVLVRRLKLNKQARRIYDEKSGSHYQIITADAKGELGHNPHCFNLDEVLSQVDNSLWDAMVTAAGARLQEMMLATSTETNDPGSFGADLIDEAERIQNDPASNTHTFAFVRKMPRTDGELEALRRRFAGHPHLPVSLDVWDERNWKWSNPALDDFKSRESMRRQAADAKAEPAKENAFRQFQCNQRVSQVTRWMPLHLWDACTQSLVDEDRLRGRICYAGLDLAATTDLAAVAYLFPPRRGVDEPFDVVWRCWTPEDNLRSLDKYTGGKASVWSREGLLTVTPGDWIDYSTIQGQLDQDATNFEVVQLGYDPWQAIETVQYLMSHGMDCVPVRQGYAVFSPTMAELMRLVRMKGLNHGAHPIARWNADALEIQADPSGNIRPVKPDRSASPKRIDLMVALIMALYCQQMHMQEPVPELWVGWTG